MLECTDSVQRSMPDMDSSAVGKLESCSFDCRKGPV